MLNTACYFETPSKIGSLQIRTHCTNNHGLYLGTEAWLGHNQEKFVGKFVSWVTTPSMMIYTTI